MCSERSACVLALLPLLSILATHIAPSTTQSCTPWHSLNRSSASCQAPAYYNSVGQVPSGLQGRATRCCKPRLLLSAYGELRDRKCISNKRILGKMLDKMSGDGHISRGGRGLFAADTGRPCRTYRSRLSCSPHSQHGCPRILTSGTHTRNKCDSVQRVRIRCNSQQARHREQRMQLCCYKATVKTIESMDNQTPDCYLFTARCAVIVKRCR
jgi:hypothetical protein